MQTVQKILIVSPAWIGDLIMSQALLKALKYRYSNVIIHVLVSEALAPILKCMPEVDQVIISPFKHGELKLIERYRLGKYLRKPGYDQAIMLPNSLKSALIPLFAKIPKRTGWVGESRYILLNDIRFLDKKRLPMMVLRYLALGFDNNQYPNSNCREYWPKLNTIDPQETLAKFQLSLQRPILALCPGAEFGPTKRWPPVYFGEVAKIMAARGWDIWLFGSSKEQSVAATIQQHCGNVCIDLTSKTSILEAIDLISLSTTVVANDSGLMHVAAALGRKVIAIYGATDPSFAPPLVDYAKSISLNLPCTPCAQKECPLGTLKCLVDIKPEMIVAEIES